MTAASLATAHARSSSSCLDLDVVIVSFQCRELVLAAIESLAAGDAVPAAITVVDNDSGDGTVDAIVREHPAVGVVRLDANTGFAHAVNVGMCIGTSRYVLVLNPDTRVAHDALQRLVQFADAHPQAGIVAPGLLNPDGSDQLTARSFPTPAAALFGRRSPLTRAFPNNPWSTRFLSGRGHSGGEPFRVDWVSGAAMLVPRRAIKKIGGFDEEFFLFWEDADWCRRMAHAGWQVWCVPSSRITHHEGGSRGHRWSLRTIRWFHQGAYRYWVKHHAPSPWNPTRWAAAALLTTRAALLSARCMASGLAGARVRLRRRGDL